MLTAHGKTLIDHLCPPDERAFRPVAEALANICRFAGRGPWYSALQHSLVVGTLCRDDEPPLELYGLLHDCQEALTGDANAPFKTDSQRRMEHEVRDRLFDAWGIPVPAQWVWHRVKSADLAATQAEWEVLKLGDGPRPVEIPNVVAPSERAVELTERKHKRGFLCAGAMQFAKQFCTRCEQALGRVK